jgi:hypothetical protein
MRQLLLLFIGSMLFVNLSAQPTDPMPWSLKDANFKFFNIDDSISTDFPASMQGWLASHLDSPDTPPYKFHYFRRCTFMQSG